MGENRSRCTQDLLWDSLLECPPCSPPSPSSSVVSLRSPAVSLSPPPASECWLLSYKMGVSAAGSITPHKDRKKWGGRAPTSPLLPMMGHTATFFAKEAAKASIQQKEQV